MKKNLNKKAFSLVELMVIIGIIGIMSSVVIVSLQRGKVEKELETAAREVSAAIREAQNDALTGKSTNPEDPGTCFNTWFGTYNNLNPNQYHVGTDTGCGVTTVYYLKNGVTFSNENMLVNFSIPFGNISSNVGFPVKIILSKGDSQYHVCVNGAGAVTEQKGAC